MQYKFLDLSSLKSTKQFVNDMDSGKVDILVNNAGLWGSPEPVTIDGLEQTFATNYLSHFYLTQLMLKKYNLKKVINVSSGLYTRAKIDSTNLEDLIKVPEKLDKDVYRQLYSTSKLAQIYHARELSRRHPEISCVSLTPGMVYTDLARHVKPNSVLLSIIGRLLPLVIRTPEEGAQISVYCCVEDELENGAFYSSDGVVRDLEEVACDQEVQRALWDFSKKLIEEKTK